ncbi:hypothetical protein B0H17DRAFT_1135083 [Mycena rosella]|uniref:Uncharacterized protein n=1 Tax=Mycena rosella TaxID=1033263 RepID=A0AAD7DEH3_MYCRO|nr:hypothetical protein B0H17DRAFT_1135083 [Mycena rosella]
MLTWSSSKNFKVEVMDLATRQWDASRKFMKFERQLRPFRYPEIREHVLKIAIYEYIPDADVVAARSIVAARTGEKILKLESSPITKISPHREYRRSDANVRTVIYGDPKTRWDNLGTMVRIPNPSGAS